MATYHVKFRVTYVGGTCDAWNEALPQEKYNWYCDGGQGDAIFVFASHFISTTCMLNGRKVIT